LVIDGFLTLLSERSHNRIPQLSINGPLYLHGKTPATLRQNLLKNPHNIGAMIAPNTPVQKAFSFGILHRNQ
jgi:hypothetical protein